MLADDAMAEKARCEWHTIQKRRRSIVSSWKVGLLIDTFDPKPKLRELHEQEFQRGQNRARWRAVNATLQTP